MDSSASDTVTTRRTKTRASTGSVDLQQVVVEDKLERRTRSISPRMGARKRRYSGSENSDTVNGPASVDIFGKNPSREPSKAGNPISNSNSSGMNGSVDTVNGSRRHFTRSKRGDSPEDEEKTGSNGTSTSRRSRKRVSFVGLELESKRIIGYWVFCTYECVCLLSYRLSHTLNFFLRNTIASNIFLQT